MQALVQTIILAMFLMGMATVVHAAQFPVVTNKVYDQTRYQEYELTLAAQLNDTDGSASPVLKITRKGSQGELRLLSFQPVRFVKENGKLFILGKSETGLQLYRLDDPVSPPYGVKNLSH